MKVAVGNFLKGDAEEASHETVDGESVGGGEDPAFAGLSEGVIAEFNDLVGAAAKDDVIAGEAVFLGNSIAQGKSGAIGIEVRMLESIANGLEGFGGGSQRVFVGSKFDDLAGI